MSEKKGRSALRAVLLGILASFFFAFTFVLNKAMDLSGGSWIWSSSLRYLFMIPFLFLLVFYRGNWKPLFAELRARPLAWIGWSTVGFGFFYAPLSFAAAYGPAWLVAGTWQITIVAGSLLVPFFTETVLTPNGPVQVRQRIPVIGLLMSLIILLGVALMHVQEADHLDVREMLLGIVPVVIAAFAYPLGNRKMMEVCQGRLDAYQRVLGMTLASLPVWLILSLYGLATVGAPSASQMGQSLLVAICSGLIATVLFFSATDLVKDSPHKLAAVEATQAGEVIFAVLGEMVLLSGQFPAWWSWLGMGLVVVGMVLHSYVSHGIQTGVSAEEAGTLTE